MRENRSLDEFLDPSTDRSAPRADGKSATDDDRVAQRDGSEDAVEEDDHSEPSEAEVEDATDDAGPATDTPTEPLQPTLRWSPDGETCSACDGRAARLWRDDGGLVCADCKTW